MMRFPLGNSPFGTIVNPPLHTIDVAGTNLLIFLALAVLSDFNQSTDIELASALAPRYPVIFTNVCAKGKVNHI
jgi:hypothetical protein